MKTERYVVKFVGSESWVIMAFNWKHAAIMACAERIKNGQHTNGLSVVEPDGTMHTYVECHVTGTKGKFGVDKRE